MIYKVVHSTPTRPHGSEVSPPGHRWVSVLIQAGPRAARTPAGVAPGGPPSLETTQHRHVAGSQLAVRSMGGAVVRIRTTVCLSLQHIRLSFSVRRYVGLRLSVSVRRYVRLSVCLYVDIYKSVCKLVICICLSLYVDI